MILFTCMCPISTSAKNICNTQKFKKKNEIQYKYRERRYKSDIKLSFIKDKSEADQTGH